MKNWRISSIPIRQNSKLLFPLLLVLTLAAAILSLTLGAAEIPLSTILRILTGKESGTVEANILVLTRLPRTIGALSGGAALAVSGAVIQSVLNNPLAAPNIIGVNSGAGFGVALWSVLLPASVFTPPLAAFFGALASVLLVLLIAEKTGASRITLVLAGVAVSSLFSAGIDGIVTFFPDILQGYSDFRIGGLANLTMKRIVPSLPIIAAALILLLSLSHDLDVLSLGMDTAMSLGMPAKRMRILFLALAAAMAGAAVSFCGLLGFVGLIIPHVMRRLAPRNSFSLILSSAMAGAFFLTLCDVLSRLLFRPYELPVGILLSAVGAPFFLWLLIHQRGGRIHD